MAKKKEKKSVPQGKAYIYSTFNNVIVTLTDVGGNVIAWGSSGTAGFKGSRKGTPLLLNWRVNRLRDVPRSLGCVR